MIEFNMNTGTSTAEVPFTEGQQTTNMSYQYQNVPYGYENMYSYGGYQSPQQFNGQMGMYGQQMSYGMPQPQYGGFYQQQVPYGYEQQMMYQQQPMYGYQQQLNYGYAPQQQVPYGYEQQMMYQQQPMYGGYQQQPNYGYAPQQVPYGYEQQMMYQQQPIYGYQPQAYQNGPYMDQPMVYNRRDFPFGSSDPEEDIRPFPNIYNEVSENEFLKYPQVQAFIKQHSLNLVNPDHFQMAKQFAATQGIPLGRVHQPGIKTWEFMRNPRPEMMPNNPAMDPRYSTLGVGGIGYNGGPNLNTIPYNGGAPINQQMGYGAMPQYQPPMEDQIVHVDGFKMPGSQFLIPADIVDRINKLQADMIVELEEENVKRAKKRQGEFNANPASVYGFNNADWEYRNILNKYYRKIDELVEECRAKKSNLNRRLVKMCRHFAGEDISDEELDKLFYGQDYKIPASKIQIPDNYAYLASMVPVTECYNPYYLHALERKKLFENVYGPDVPGNDKFLKNTSLIEDYEQMEEARREKLSYGTNGMFNQQQYLHQLRRNIADRLSTDPEYRGYGVSRESLNRFAQGDDDVLDAYGNIIPEEYRNSPSAVPNNIPHRETPVPNDVSGVDDLDFKPPKSLISAEPPTDTKNYFKVMQNKDGSFELSPPDWIIESALGKEALARQMLEDSYNERKVAFYQALHSDGGD